MRQTFRVKSVARQLGPLIAICLVTLGILSAVTEPDDRPLIMGILGAVLLVSIILAGWLLTRTRLDISADGITYHAIGFRVTGRWEDVAGTARRVMGVQEPECLILRKPGIEMSGWMALGYKLLPAASLAALLGGKVSPSSDLSGVEDAIPVGLFDKDWRTGEIGTLIRSYAPAVLDTQAG